MNKFESVQQMFYYRSHLSNYAIVQKDTGNILTRKPNWDYNCYGYAVGFYDWLDLDSFCYMGDDEDDRDALEMMAAECANEVEMALKNCRQIIGPSHAKPNERVFALRVGYDDFHFARLNSDGIWTHKPGGNTIREMTEDELYGDEWCPQREYPYISTIYFFAIKKGKVEFN